MGANTNIEWCDDTGNLWWGCFEVHDGCTNCYARVWAQRWGKELWGNNMPRERKKSAFTNLDKYQNKAAAEGIIRKVFVGSMMDIFEKSMPLTDPNEDFKTTGDMRQELFNRIDAGRYPNLVFLLLTKRPSNVLKMVPPHWKGNAPQNVWIGITIADVQSQHNVLRWMPTLNNYFFTFWSVEPLLEDLDYIHLIEQPAHAYPDWVICGGESGKNKRPFDIAWAESLMHFSAANDIPFFMKQVDKVRPVPPHLMVRQFPESMRSYAA